jgi:tRNA G10  N-methylase Trm11
VFATVLSSLIISRGSGVSMAMDLSRSRPHRVDAKKPKRPLHLWQRQIEVFARFYSTSRLAEHASLAVGDARELDLRDETIDAVITSPPYLNAIDYMRTSKFSLLFLGDRLARLRAIRSESVGTEVGLSRGELPEDLDRLVDDGVSDPRRRPMIRRYLLDMKSALTESNRVLKPGGRALYVVGPSILSRREYDAGNVLGILARSERFRVVAQGRRDISAANRSLPPPRRTSRGQSIHHRMTCELYVLLVKDD